MFASIRVTLRCSRSSHSSTFSASPAARSSFTQSISPMHVTSGLLRSCDTAWVNCSISSFLCLSSALCRPRRSAASRYRASLSPSCPPSRLDSSNSVVVRWVCSRKTWAAWAIRPTSSRR